MPQGWAASPAPREKTQTSTTNINTERLDLTDRVSEREREREKKKLSVFSVLSPPAATGMSKKIEAEREECNRGKRGRFLHSKEKIGEF